MLGPGPAKLIDFGIARSPRDATDGDTSIGSLQYMSPEQLHGEPLTPASDLFSLGVVLYEALTGRVPYPGSTPEEVSAAQRAGAVKPPSALGAGTGGRLDDAILQALQRDPDARFRSAEAMTQALASAADELGRDDDTTRVVVPAQGRGAYVPPPAERPMPAPAWRGPPPSPRQAPAPPRRRSSPWGLVGAILIVAAAALVVIFVVVPLLQLGGEGGQGVPSATSAASPEPGTVLVPQTVGMPTRDAIDAANAASLDWTVRCNEDPGQPEGIIDQEPPAGTAVAPGSPFTMFSARIADCR
jgi:serine/threonine-protein kinase